MFTCNNLGKIHAVIFIRHDHLYVGLTRKDELHPEADIKGEAMLLGNMVLTRTEQLHIIQEVETFHTHKHKCEYA